MSRCKCEEGKWVGLGYRPVCQRYEENEFITDECDNCGHDKDCHKFEE